MQCTLLIPHLFWPEGAMGGGAELPALERILARARRRSFPALPVEAWLCQAFEVERQPDWPVAPLTLAVDGGAPGTSYWLRADPAHVRAQRDELRLADASILDATREDADALVAALNAHFAADGLSFIAPHPDRWYLELAARPGLETRTLSEAAGADITALIPAGPDALKWHRIANEIQMLLHAHPVNEAREARGALPINSVWLWGGGALPPVPGRHFGAVWSDDRLALALAAATDLEATPAPGDARQWHARAQEGGLETHLVVLDALTAPARYGDVTAWRERTARLERDWFAPFADGDVSAELALITLGQGGCERFELGAAQRWRFWRRREPLAAYCAR